MQIARWFSLAGCPNCDMVRQFFLANKIEAQEIEIGADPIIGAGIRSMANGQFLAPVVYCGLTNSVFFGNQPDQLQKIVEAVNAIRGGQSSPVSSPVAS